MPSQSRERDLFDNYILQFYILCHTLLSNLRFSYGIYSSLMVLYTRSLRFISAAETDFNDGVSAKFIPASAVLLPVTSAEFLSLSAVSSRRTATAYT